NVSQLLRRFSAHSRRQRSGRRHRCRRSNAHHRHAVDDRRDGNRRRCPRRIDVADAARFARYRLSRSGQEGADHLCGVPYPRLVDRFAERDRGNFAVHHRRGIFLGQELHQQHQFLRGDQATHASYFKKLKDAVVIEIPKLNEMAYEQVELASVPFLTFVANKDSKAETANYSFVLRGYVRHWLGNVWAEYDRVKLLDLLGAATEAA